MRIPRRTLALPVALLLTFGTAASAQAAITITSPTHSPEGFTNDRTPDVTFTGAAPLGVVTLEIDAVVVDTVTADGSGNGTLTPDAAISSDPIDVDEDGNPIGNRYGLTVRDPAGDSPNQDSVTVHIDQAPSITGTGDGTYAAAAVAFTASSAIPGNDVNLYIDGDLDQIATAESDGTVLEDFVPTAALLTPGPHTAYLTSVDDNGNESSPSDTVDLDIAPPAPTFTQVFENVQLNRAASPIAFYNVDATATDVTLYELDDDGDEVQIGRATPAGGTATITPTLSDGRHYLVATQTVSGVETVSYLGDNGPTTVIVNTSAPVLETSFDGTVTDVNRPYFYAENVLANLSDNDTSALLYVDGVPAGSDDGDGGGNAGIQPDVALADGPHSAYVVTIDDLGHESTVHSNTVSFTVDTVGPAAPNVTSPADGSTTATSLPVLTATAEPGSYVHVLVDDVGEEGDQLADADGNVTFTLTQALADGVHTLHVFARDAVGNWGEFTTTTFTVVTPKAPPTPPVVVPPVVTPPVTTPKNPVDLDGDGIDNNWLVGGKAAPAPGTPTAKVSPGKVELKLPAAPKGATKIRVYRADGNGGYKLVKTVTVKSKSFTDKTVKAGHTYKYKTVGVNAKGQQGTASKTATAKVKKK